MNKETTRFNRLINALLAASLDYHLKMEQEEDLLLLMTELICLFHGEKGVLLKFVSHSRDIAANIRIDA